MDCSAQTEPEGWRQLSLEQQIERWKVETERAFWEIPVERPLGWVKLYQQGVVPKMMFDCEVLWSIRETNVAEFLNQCPADVLSELVAIMAELPRDSDEDWPRWGGGGDPHTPLGVPASLSMRSQTWPSGTEIDRKATERECVCFVAPYSSQ